VEATACSRGGRGATLLYGTAARFKVLVKWSSAPAASNTDVSTRRRATVWCLDFSFQNLSSARVQKLLEHRRKPCANCIMSPGCICGSELAHVNLLEKGCNLLSVLGSFTCWSSSTGYRMERRMRIREPTVQKRVVSFTIVNLCLPYCSLQSHQMFDPGGSRN
jgi:hypothetical protein